MTRQNGHCVSPDPPELAAEQSSDATRRHLRGSTLLLAGRVFALVANFLTQVVIVRYLAKNDYGAFAYALASVSMLSSLNLLGLHRAVNRFVPIFHERKDYGSMLGAVLVATMTIAGLGLALVALTFGLEGVLRDRVVQNPRSAGLLLILIGLVPLQSLDSVFQGTAAALVGAKAIFWRRHVLAPTLRLASVVLVILVEGRVELLATCYLVAGAIGVAVYVRVLYRLLRRESWFEYLRPGSLRLPARDLFRFSLPAMTTDLVLILKTTLAVLIVEYFHGTESVADFRAVFPLAGLNLMVLQGLKVMFTPAASRLFQARDSEGINDLYWQSALWITIATFPLFAVCLFLSEPVTVLLFGERYSAESGSVASTVLILLAIGNYFNAAMGLNTYTLQVYARVGLVAGINTIATIASIALYLWLIPAHGATGAAIATALTAILHNILNHAGLMWRTDVRITAWRGWKVYAAVATMLGILALVRVTFEPSTPAMALVVAFASAALLFAHRDTLRIAETFPELARVPVVGGLLTKERRR